MNFINRIIENVGENISLSDSSGNGKFDYLKAPTRIVRMWLLFSYRERCEGARKLFHIRIVTQVTRFKEKPHKRLPSNENRVKISKRWLIKT